MREMRAAAMKRASIVIALAIVSGGYAYAQFRDDFFGFDLKEEDARGGTGAPGDDDPGWFFVLKERPGDPRAPS